MCIYMVIIKCWLNDGLRLMVGVESIEECSDLVVNFLEAGLTVDLVAGSVVHLVQALVMDLVAGIIVNLVADSVMELVAGLVVDLVAGSVVDLIAGSVVELVAGSVVDLMARSVVNLVTGSVVDLGPSLRGRLSGGRLIGEFTDRLCVNCLITY